MGFVRRHRLAIELALFALVAYLAAVGVTTALDAAVDAVPPPPVEPAAAPPPHGPGPLADYALIAERDLFNPAREGGAPARHAALRLWGVGLQGRDARAVIEDTATHRQELYRVGDQVGGARIASIDWDRVTLEGDGGEEVLELAPPAAAPSAETPLGLRNGDVVERVNGTQVGAPTALLAFLQRLRTEPRVALDIVRGDTPRTLVYDLR